METIPGFVEPSWVIYRIMTTIPVEREEVRVNDMGYEVCKYHLANASDFVTQESSVYCFADA